MSECINSVFKEMQCFLDRKAEVEKNRHKKTKER